MHPSWLIQTELESGQKKSEIGSSPFNGDGGSEGWETLFAQLFRPDDNEKAAGPERATVLRTVLAQGLRGTKQGI